MKYFYMLIVAIIAAGCGTKYPIPAEPNEGMPGQEEYIEIKNTGWDSVALKNGKDIIVGNDGYIYVLDNDTIKKYSQNGHALGGIFSLRGAVAIGQDEDENIYIASKHAIYMLYWNGNIMDSIKDTLICINSIYPMGDSDVFISDSVHNLVVRIEKDSIDTVATYGSGINYTNKPCGIYASIERNIVIFASKDNNWVDGLSIQRPHYNIIHLGGNTHDGGQEQGVFTSPTDVAMDSASHVFVLDQGNKRVQKFDNSSDFITELLFDESPVGIAVTRSGEYIYAIFKTCVKLYKKPVIPGQQGGEQ